MQAHNSSLVSYFESEHFVLFVEYSTYLRYVEEQVVGMKRFILTIFDLRIYCFAPDHVTEDAQKRFIFRYIFQ